MNCHATHDIIARMHRYMSKERVKHNILYNNKSSNNQSEINQNFIVSWCDSSYCH